MKNRIEVPTEKLKLSEVLEKLWIYLIVDFITKLPVVVEKDEILVVCNRLFKIAYFVGIIEETLVKRLMQLFRDNVWKLHGLIESVVLDRGPQFAVGLTQKLNRMLEIETKLSILFYS